MATHVVAAGDTLYGLARRYGTTVGELQALNQLPDGGFIFVGQALTVPDPPGGGGAPPAGGPVTYTVAAGDTLYSIARRFGTTVGALQARNGIADPGALQVGQVLVVAEGTVTEEPTNPPAGTALLPLALFGSRATDPALTGLIPLFDAWADMYAIARNLLKGLAFVESGWRVDARSTSGAIGLCQLLPSTAAWVSTALLGVAPLDTPEPNANLQLGSRYLRYLFDLLGEETAAVAAYYQGPGSVQRDGINAGGATYANRVFTARAQFS